MPPKPKRNCAIIIYDLNCKEKRSAQRALTKIACEKYFSGSKDLVKLILLNTNRTANNIYEVDHEFVLYSPNYLLTEVYNKEVSLTENWLEALQIAIKSFQDDHFDSRGVVTYQIILISDLNFSPFSEQNTINAVIKGLQETGAFLYVIGREVELPNFPINNHKDVKAWMSNLMFKKGNLNTIVIEEIVRKSPNSVVADWCMGPHLIISFKNWPAKQPWNVPLAAGTKIMFKATTRKYIDPGQNIKLKEKRNVVVPVTWVDTDDEDRKVDIREIRHGISRHGKFVEMPDNKLFKVPAPRGFSILCFTSSHRVPEYLMRGGGTYFTVGLGAKNDAFNILLERLAQDKKYIIAQRVYQNNLSPKIVVLMPQPNHNPKGFLLAPLPFSDSVRCNYVEQSNDHARKVTVPLVVSNFLNSLKHRQNYLGVTMIKDINSEKISNAASVKVLGGDLKLHKLDIDLCNPNEETKEIANFKEFWPARDYVACEQDGSDFDSDDDYFSKFK